MENCLKTIGNHIRSYRKDQGMSQGELGKKAGLHYTYIGQVERGEKNITVMSLNKISEALGISMAGLLSGAAEEGQAADGALIRADDTAKGRLPGGRSMPDDR